MPDPWTQTNASGNYFLLKLSKAISNFVNSNATGRFGIQDVMWVILGLFIFIPLKRWLNLIRLLVKVKKPGVKATILDVILSELFISLRNTRVPDLAYLFLNGGAHIQHHYFFNSASYTGNLRNPEWYCPNDWDPVYEILDVYDNLIGDLIKSGDKLLCITALHQVPHEEETYYWRPINHESFLLEFGLVKPFRVVPRMSRDFLIVADDEQELSQMQETLSSFVDSHKGGQVFAVDNRGLSLFVEIVYDGPITSDLFFKNASGCSVYNLDSKLAFVAIKNGKHHRTGFLFSNFSLDSLDETIPLTRVRDFVESIALSDLDKKIQK